MQLGRRSFFKALGGAVLGTAIALRIPDSLMPRAHFDSPHTSAYELHVNRLAAAGFKPLSFDEWHQRMRGAPMQMGKPGTDTPSPVLKNRRVMH